MVTISAKNYRNFYNKMMTEEKSSSRLYFEKLTVCNKWKSR